MYRIVSKERRRFFWKGTEYHIQSDYGSLGPFESYSEARDALSILKLFSKDEMDELIRVHKAREV